MTALTSPLLLAMLAGAAVVAGMGPRRRLPTRRLPAPHPVRRASARPPWLAPTLAFLAVVWVAVVAGTMAAGVASAIAATAVAARRRARRRRKEAARDRALPELIDLFRLAASAGQPVATAITTVAPRAPAPVRVAVVAARSHLSAGGSVAGAVERLAAGLGPDGRELADALADAARSGTALVAVLDRVALTARNRRTRAAEEAARRLPVTLLFPLAGCVLPAAVLLAVVPVAAASLGSLAS
ncbi:MAG: type II secretion system F family protein [Acidimicrobiales bacterium]